MLRIAGAALVVCALTITPCFANQFNSGGAHGDNMHTNGHTAPQSSGNPTGYGNVAGRTGTQASTLMPTYLGQLTPGGLPKTQYGSFVQEAGGSAEQIYGDEGAWGIPPYFGFTEDHRIGSGNLPSQLSTGHGSTLPSSWGYPGETENSGPDFAANPLATFAVPGAAAVLNPRVAPIEPTYNTSIPNNPYLVTGPSTPTFLSGF